MNSAYDHHSANEGNVSLGDRVNANAVAVAPDLKQVTACNRDQLKLKPENAVGTR